MSSIVQISMGICIIKSLLKVQINTQTPRKVSHVSSSFQTLFIKLDLPKASVNQPLSLLSFTPAIPYVTENPPTLPATIYVDEA
ncbi:hypothetical protein EAE99_004253 [Botrytis elliptica]|nr:hypothetical protein EAE99_004253 [Botrytis elliptica]